jgi:hypothetical protein
MGGNDTIDFSRFGSAVWIDLAVNGSQASTRDNAGLVSDTSREVANLTPSSRSSAPTLRATCAVILPF